MARPTNATAIAGHIAGLREAKAAFQALPEVVRARLLSATETTLREVVRLAKMRIAANPSIQTRTLFNAIGYTLNKKSGRGKAGVSNVSTTITVGGKTFKVKGLLVAGRGGSASTAKGARLIRPSRYAHLIEFGSRRQRKEPFMLPAVQSQEQAYLSRCQAQGPAIEKDVAAIGLRNL